MRACSPPARPPAKSAEVAFLESPRSFEDIGQRFGEVGWLFCVNRLVDALFIVDLVLQFRLMYSEANSTEGMRWVTDPFQIARHYLLGWFTIDIMSIGVAAFDIIPLLQQGGGGDQVGAVARTRDDAHAHAHQ